jgi:VanZ family protein
MYMSWSGVSVRSILVLLSLLNISFIAIGSWLPFNFHRLSLSEFIVHFGDSSLSNQSTDDAAVNTVITIPLAFFVFAYLNDLNPCSRVWKLANAFFSLLFIVVFSFFIEFSQVWFVGRFPSYRDVQCQFVGATIGLGIALVLSERFTSWLTKSIDLRKNTSRLEWMLECYLLGLVLYSVFPLDLITSVSELWDKFQDGKIEIVPRIRGRGGLLEFLYRSFTGVLRYVPVGFLFSFKRFRTDDRLSILHGFLFGAAISCIVEIAQVFLRTRVASGFDAFLGIFGAFIGLILSSSLHSESKTLNESDSLQFSERSGFHALWMILAVGLYSVFLAMIFWYPYDFTYDGYIVRNGLGFLLHHPFDSVFRGEPIRTIFAGIHKFLWFFPLGFLTGTLFWTSTRCDLPKFILVIVSVCFLGAIAFVVEIVQILLPGRAVGIADFLLCFSGALGGFFLSFFGFLSSIIIRAPFPK